MSVSIHLEYFNDKKEKYQSYEANVWVGFDFGLPPELEGMTDAFCDKSFDTRIYAGSPKELKRNTTLFLLTLKRDLNADGDVDEALRKVENNKVVGWDKL